MSKRKITIGTTLGDAMNFAVGNIFQIIGMTWLPILAMVASIVFGMVWIMDFDLEQIENWSDSVEASEIPFPWLVPDPEGATPDEQPEDDASGGNEGGKPEGGKQDGKSEMDEDLAVLMGAMSGVDSARLFIGIPLIFIAVLVFQTIPIVGYTRMQIRGKPPILWPFYFRLGPTEIRLTITLFLISLIIALAMIVVIVPIMIIGSMISAAGGEPNPAMGLAVIPFVIVALVIGLPWLFARMGMAIPIAVNEGGIGIARAWRASSGYGFALTVSAIVAVVIILVISLLVQFVLTAVISIPVSLIAGAMGEPNLAVLLGIGILAIIVMVALQGFQNAFLYGLFTAAYKNLRAGTEADETVAT